jgi:hypothetical protein
MIRNSFAAVLLCLGATLLCAQAPTDTTGKTTNPGTVSGPGQEPTTSGTTGQGGSGKKSGSSTGSSSTGTTSTTGSSSKKPEPGSLEDSIDKALRNNADIRAAEAKVRDAEAELNRVRHQVVAKVATLKHDITTARKMLEFAEKQLNAVSRAAASQQELQTALATVEKQKADLTRLETEMQSLTGGWKNVISSAFSPDGKLLYSAAIDGAVRIWDVETGHAVNVKAEEFLGKIDISSGVQAPMAERVKAALNKTVKVEEFKEELPLGEALAYLVRKAGVDVPFRPIGKLENAPVMLMKGELPLGAWLQVFEDSADVRFVVREYGILVTTVNRIPQGAISVQDFWKRGDRPKTEAPKVGNPTTVPMSR